MMQDTQNNVDPLPFQNINDDEFEILNEINIAKSYHDMDRLSKLRFNPFETDQNIALSSNNLNLDSKCLVITIYLRISKTVQKI
jgi:hypothetical protein